MKPVQKPRKVDNYLKETVVFYCKDCEKIVKVRPFGRKFVYRCAICGTKNVAFGTENAIKNYYRVDDSIQNTEKKVEPPAEEIPSKDIPVNR